MDISEGTEYWLNVNSEAEAKGKVMTGDWDATTNKHLEMIKRLDIKPTDIVLDYGCGVGRLLYPVSKQCKNIVGADISDKILSYAIKNVNANVHFLSLKDEAGKGLPINFFDKVFSIIVLQHIEKYKAVRALIKLNNSLKVGGSMLIQFPNLHELAEMYTLYTKNKYSFGGLEPRMEFYCKTELEYIFNMMGMNYEIIEDGTDYYVLAQKTKNIIPLRCDMFDWFEGRRHKLNTKLEDEE